MGRVGLDERTDAVEDALQAEAVSVLGVVGAVVGGASCSADASCGEEGMFVKNASE